MTIVVLCVSVKKEYVSSLRSFANIYRRQIHFKAKRDC